MIKLKRNGKTYMLTKEQFRNYMYTLWKAAQAKKVAKQDIREDRKGA